ncbi:unnamed protein product (mitochondrion) [Plasmodiophora brassicae]|uniref:20S-pre-rRNA D-site endonuclease NOB1 n=1 Tax=Plasmodiophora brassicae TaxID=37360 RepID=A0A0G4J617_PLABS|nr:hypothetical protein PBRA_009238 [Plasmodiophora brassicae]SPR01515.1 unnamed protein product [Plasmodiophora brassicae]
MGPTDDVPLEHVILDAGSLMATTTTTFLGGMAAQGCQLWTTPDVLNEVRDPVARAALDALPFKIGTRPVDSAALDAVAQFAKETGDYYVLSATDLRVLALTYMIERERHGGAHIRRHPKQLRSSAVVDGRRRAFVPPATQPGTPAAVEQPPADGERRPLHEEQLVEGLNVALTLAETSTGDQAAARVDDDDDGGGEWITVENIASQKHGGRQAGQQQRRSTSSVSCVTTDFAMQNVMLQMGLRLTSVDGKAIRSAAQWCLRCYACYKITMDMSRVFCGSCGGPTLSRSRVKVTSGGWIKYRHSARQAANLRGTIYSIPKPRGGRHNNDLVLRDDELRRPRRDNKAPSVDELLENASEFGLNASGGARRDRVRVGHPRGRQVNAAVKRSAKR